MPIESERQLLTLALEFSAAKEPLSATESFGRYLRQRFQPDTLDHVELDKSSSSFLQEQIFREDQGNFYFLLPITIPVVFTLKECAKEKPSDYELGVLRKIVLFFKERMESLAELKGLTYTDDLTGLYNQRYLELILDRELSLAKRNATKFSVLFMDLDHFKNVNDSHGHLIGSRLLYEVGQEIKKALRESDITFRYGGDEFVMILSHTGLEDAMLVAERIRSQIEKKRFLARDAMDIRLTASIGIACVPDHAVTKSQILKAADEALYGVKKAVRNRVMVASATKA